MLRSVGLFQNIKTLCYRQETQVENLFEIGREVGYHKSGSNSYAISGEEMRKEGCIGGDAFDWRSRVRIGFCTWRNGLQEIDSLSPQHPFGLGGSVMSERHPQSQPNEPQDCWNSQFTTE